MAKLSANRDPLTQHIVALINAGHTLDQVAGRLKLHRSSVYRRKLAAGVARRWRPLSELERQRIRKLIQADYSRRQVAAMVGRGLGTVARLAAFLQDAGRRRRVRQPYRCPRCGYKISMRPCLICESLECRHVGND